MSKSIWKYEVDINDEFFIKMPEGARVLHVGVQEGAMFICALVDTDSQTLHVKRRFALRGTGHPCEDLDDVPHVGTCILHDGRLVFHLFDRGEEAF